MPFQKGKQLSKKAISAEHTSPFKKQLHNMGMNEAEYLKEAQNKARKTGYNPNLLSFADDSTHKLQYESPEGIKRFGRVDYNDFILWKYLEKFEVAPKGYANMKRNTFRKSHKEITKKFKLNKFSPNELAINILW